MINFVIHCGEFNVFSQLKLSEKNTFKTNDSGQRTKFKKHSKTPELEAYSEPYQMFKMDPFSKIANEF